MNYHILLTGQAKKTATQPGRIFKNLVSFFIWNINSVFKINDFIHAPIA